MSNKVSVELEAKVSGFQKGMKDASDSMKQYETDTRKISESTVNLKKELGQARREAMNLAAGYAKLSQEAKNSDFGKEMKRQLDEAKKAAADLIDIQGDVQQELKNMASDTRLLDTLSEGIGVLGNAFSSTVGVIAQFTGKEEDAKRAVVAFTTVTSTLSTVTKLQNALQSQSNTMMAVAKIQTLAAAAAERIKTAATNKGTLATRGATAAQAAFNAVAKANPYVLLGSAILACVSAFFLFTNKTKDATNAMEENSEAVQEAKRMQENWNNTVTSTFTSLYSKYEDLRRQWIRLKSEHQKKEWLENNKKAFQELGLAVDGLKSAEDIFINNTQSVVEAFKKRAEAAAMYDRIKELYAKKAELILKKEDAQNAIAQDAAKQGRHAKAGDEIKDQTYRNSGYGKVNAQGKWVFTEQGAARYSGTDTSKNPVVQNIDNQIGDIDSQVDKIVGLLEGGVGTTNTIVENTTPTGGGNKTTEQNVKVDVEPVEGSADYVAKVIATLKQKLKSEVMDDTERQYLLQDIKALEDEYRSMTTLMSNPIQPEVELSPLQKLNKELEELRKQLELAPNTEAYQEALQKVVDKEKEIKQFKGETDTADVANDTKDAWKSAAGAIQSVGSAMQSIEDPAVKIAGMIGQAIATIALGFAQAIGGEGTKGNVWYLIAAAAAGVAAMISTISAIHSSTGYAEGGIVGGSSYAGDRINARLNSGEMVLNQRQQRNLFNLLDTSAMPQSGGTNIQVHGVVRGTDLILVQRNTNKVRSKAGLSVNF